MIRPPPTEAQSLFVAPFRAARTWLDELVADPAVTVAWIAARAKRTGRSIRQTPSRAFLDPELVETAIEENLPRSFRLERIFVIPQARDAQWTAVGLGGHPSAADRIALFRDRALNHPHRQVVSD